jgi:pyruvate formate lyase activating enzyme
MFDALEAVGHQKTVSEILEEVLKDKTFYDCSGSGVTLSGGEPMFQLQFI